MGCSLNMSTAMRPQTDGLAERIHRTIETMVRPFVNRLQTNWDELMPSLEFAYNNTKQSATEQSPFMLVYGQSPLTPAALLAQSVLPPDLNPMAQDRIEKLRAAQQMARECILESQEKMKAHVDASRTEHEFKVGDKVLLSDLAWGLPDAGPTTKFNPLYSGPYEILEAVNANAYRLKLPPSAGTTHTTFHVSYMKPYKDGSATYPGREPENPEPYMRKQGEAAWVVDRFLARRVRTYGKRKLRREKILVRWQGYGPADDSWEPVDRLRADLAADVFKELYDKMIEDEEAEKAAVQMATARGTQEERAPGAAAQHSEQTEEAEQDPVEQSAPAATPKKRAVRRGRRRTKRS